MKEWSDLGSRHKVRADLTPMNRTGVDSYRIMWTAESPFSCYWGYTTISFTQSGDALIDAHCSVKGIDENIINDISMLVYNRAVDLRAVLHGSMDITNDDIQIPEGRKTQTQKWLEAPKDENNADL